METTEAMETMTLTAGRERRVKTAREAAAGRTKAAIRKEVNKMMRFAIPRTAHCQEGHGKVPDMTENCPHYFIRKGGAGR